MAYIYTPFMKKVLHITERKRKSNVHHDCKSDDFRAGFKVAEWGMFCHSERLQITPARFKQVYSDSALHWHAADKPDISTSRSEINSVDRHLKIRRTISAVHPSRPQSPKTPVVRLSDIAPFSVQIRSLYQWLRKMR